MNNGVDGLRSLRALFVISGLFTVVVFAAIALMNDFLLLLPVGVAVAVFEWLAGRMYAHQNAELLASRGWRW